MTYGGATDGTERDRLSWRLGVPSGAGAKLKEAKSRRNYPKRKRKMRSFSLPEAKRRARKSRIHKPVPEVRAREQQSCSPSSLTHWLKNTKLRFAQWVLESQWIIV